MPIAIKCEDNYNIRAAAIHYFHSLQQITSRKLYMVLWSVLTTADSLQGRFSTISTVWNFNVQDLTESGRTAVFQWFFFSYTGNVLLVVRTKQNAGPLEHQYTENEITRNRPKIQKP
jgi:hypothetical protein